MSTPRFRPGIDPAPGSGGALWFAFRDADLLVVEAPPGHAHRFEVPSAADLEALGLEPRRTQYLGSLDDRPCFVAELAEDAVAPERHRFAGLRGLYDRMERAAFDVAGLAFQIQHWDRSHQFCAKCGAALAPKGGERAKRCAVCAAEYYPLVTPAVIVLVHDGPRVLMTRQPRFPADMYGLVAGFLEPGETLEACVAREVLEETGVAIRAVRYFGSQPWPFPHQVMIGFTAEYDGGELVVDRSELEDARWFDRGALPLLPPPISIARALIDAWLRG